MKPLHHCDCQWVSLFPFFQHQAKYTLPVLQLFWSDCPWERHYIKSKRNKIMGNQQPPCYFKSQAISKLWRQGNDLPLLDTCHELLQSALS